MTPDPAARPLDGTDRREWPTGRLLALAARLATQRFNEGLADLGLTHAQYLALHVLTDGPCSQAAAAQRLGVTDQTMSRTIDWLCSAGLADRRRDDRDRRRHTIAATPAGHAAYEAAARHEVLESLDAVPGLREALIAALDDLAPTGWRDAGAVAGRAAAHA